MSQRSEMFGRLLRGAINSIAVYEGKTAPVIEEEFGAQIGLAGSAIQRYKAGHVPPDPQTIRYFAEAAVQRGFLGREWLVRFLHAARYPDAERLIAGLFASPTEPARPPRAYHNLPAPTYSQFIMRAEPYAEVQSGLGKRSAAVLIIGLGGSGKTSLAREVAGNCLQGEPHFDAVVWISDKDKPGTTNLSIVLDEIARILDYPGFTQFAFDEKRREVEQLLRRQRVLVVVDNFETITDSALLAWLLDLPEPSKALITTREYRREFRRGGWPVELRGMREAEASAFVEERLRLLRLDRLIAQIHELDPLIAAAGGNPKAIELALGLIKYERRPLPQVIDDLYAARGDLFEDLFARAWKLLDQPTQEVLLALTYFPLRASVAALRTTTGLSEYTLDRATERLADLALIDIQQQRLDQPIAYTLHPLARSFAQARLAERTEFDHNCRQRWLDWHLTLIQPVEASWYNTHHLALIDPEIENLNAAIEWAVTHGHDQAALRLSATIGYYAYVRGRWSEQQQINEVRLRVARRMGNQNEEIFTLLNMLRVLALQGRMSEAQPIAAQIETALHSTHNPMQRCSLLHGLAVYALVQGDYHGGQQLLAEVIELCGSEQPYKLVRARNWLADSYLQQGEWSQAEALLRETIRQSEAIGYHRATTFGQLRLAQIAIQHQRLAEAATLLTEAQTRSIASDDRRDLALIQRTLAQLSTLQGDLVQANTYLLAAIDLFERMGMRYELAAARTRLHESRQHPHTP
ncbi:MAG: hypothetical protein OHK0050_28660 [Roseiflexaceae bacterium]